MSRGERSSGLRIARRVGAAVAAIAMVAIFTAPASAQPGALDPSFGGDGKVTTFFGNPNENLTVASSLAVQPDGKDVVANITEVFSTGVSTFGIARYNLDGSLDTSFGGDGRVKTRFFGDALASNVAIQADGKIVAVGSVRDPETQRYRAALARYDADGSLDPTFGGDGKVVTKLGGDTRVNALAIQADGKIVIGGSARLNKVGWQFALARYNVDGSLDPTFGVGGRVFTPIGDSTDQGWVDVSVQADGTILTAGTVAITPVSKFVLARYDGQGNLVSSFGDGGVTITAIAPIGQGPNESGASALVVRPNGKIVLAGSFTEVDTGQLIDAFALAQYDSDGNLDPSFGGGDGMVVAQVAGRAQGSDAVLQSNGRIIEVGQYFGPHGSPGKFFLMRFNTDGSLDATFGKSGEVKTSVGIDESFVEAAALQPNGELTVAGRARRDGTSFDLNVAAVLRYQVS
jgi:uncharacterized delta-60 repeat protein